MQSQISNRSFCTAVHNHLIYTGDFFFYLDDVLLWFTLVSTKFGVSTIYSSGVGSDM